MNVSQQLNSINCILEEKTSKRKEFFSNASSTTTTTRRRDEHVFLPSGQSPPKACQASVHYFAAVLIDFFR